MLTLEDCRSDLDLERLVKEFDPNVIADRELELGVFGPFAQRRMLQGAPRKVKDDLLRLKRFPNIFGMPGQTFSGMDAQEFPSANLRAAINTTVTETNLWDPAIWSPIPALSMRPGKVYEVMFGGTITTLATPTIAFRARFGTNNAAPPTGVDLGLGPTVTLETNAAAQPFYGEFTFGVRSMGVAASTTTATGNGFVLLPAAAASAGGEHAVFGGAIPTTLDQTVAQALSVSCIWGTNNVANSLLPTWVVFRSLN